MAVAGPVVQVKDRGIIFFQTGQIRECLIASGRIFHQDHLQPVSVQVKGLQPAERGLDRRKRFNSLFRGNAQNADSCYSRCRVIYIVDRGK